jgi:hypothetical protein
MAKLRNEFPASIKREAFKRSGGICEAHRVPMLRTTSCRSRLTAGNVFYEHIDPVELSGGNDLSNAACLCKTHWRIKTDTYDLPTIAKCNRQRDRNRAIKPDQYPPIVGTVRSGWKHFLAGGWIRR